MAIRKTENNHAPRTKIITTLPKILNGHATGGSGASASKRSAQLEKEIDRIWEEDQKHTLAAAEKICQRSQLRVKSALEKEVQRLQKENVSQSVLFSDLLNTARKNPCAFVVTCLCKPDPEFMQKEARSIGNSAPDKPLPFTMKSISMLPMSSSLDHDKWKCISFDPATNYGFIIPHKGEVFFKNTRHKIINLEWISYLL